MKKLVLFFLVAVTFASVVSCAKVEPDINTSDTVSDTAQTEKTELSFEEKIKRLSRDTVPVLQTPSDNFLSQEDAIQRAQELLMNFLSGDVKAAIDHDFDLNALASGNLGGQLRGSSEAAMWEFVFLLPESSAHMEMDISIEAVTGSLLKVAFQGKMFNPKDISRTEQDLFLRKFEEVSDYAGIQDVSLSESNYYSRNMEYETDKEVHIRAYIDIGFFSISYR